MKKVLLLALLFASISVFAGGKPTTISMSTIIKNEKEAVLPAVKFASCTHYTDLKTNAESADFDRSLWVSSRFSYIITGQDPEFDLWWADQTPSGVFYYRYRITYIAASCEPGDSSN